MTIAVDWDVKHHTKPNLLVPIAEQTGWSLNLSETPKTGFLAVMHILKRACAIGMSFVVSQNLVTLIFTQTTFVNVVIPNAWRTFCQILVALDQ